MKHLWFSAFLLFPIFGFSQVVDTTAVRREVDSLLKVSHNFIGQRDFEKALEINAATEKLTLEYFGNTSDLYAKVCHLKGYLAYIQNNLLEAEKWWFETKNIREKALGKEHPDYANSLNNLAVVYEDMGQYEKVEPLYIQAKNIYEKSVGKEHPSYAHSLNNLANLYKDMGQYDKALPLRIEAISIYEKTLGKEHPDYASSLGGLANLYSDMGQYDKAELLHIETKNILEKSLGKEHPDYAVSLYNLANLYSDMGQYDKAELLYIEAKNIWEKTVGKEHPYYAASLNSLASLYKDMGQYEKAVPICIEAKDILEKVLGKEHPHFATILGNLASLYRHMAQYEKAEPLYIEAKNISEKALGKEHPVYATTLNNLATLYFTLGSYKKAEPLFIEAKNIWEKTLGKEHPYYASSLNNLASVYQEIGQYDKAESLINEVSAINKSYIEKVQFHLSEQEIQNYLYTFSGDLNQVLSFAQISGSSEIAPTCYDNSLFYKGLQLQAGSRLQRLAGTNPISSEQFERLKGYRRRISTEYVKPIAERKNVAELEEKANTLEKELVRTVAGFGEALRQVSWQDVRDSLQPNDASIEFVRYEYYDQKSRSTDSIMYAALFLKPGETAPRFVTLFEERNIAALVKGASGKAIGKINALYAGEGAKRLYELIWKPLEPLLSGVKTVYVSPSGLLNRLNLGAISVDSSSTVGDRYRIVTLGSTRQLVLPDTVSRSGADAVLVGGVRYTSDTTAIAAVNANIAPKDWSTDVPFHQDTVTRGGGWTYLPETALEVQDIDNLLQSAGWTATLDTGFRATEEVFRSMGQGNPSPRVLHVATHGFFFPDPRENPKNEFRNLPSDQPVFRLSEHPMIRSGLLLAGADEAWSTGKPPQNREDGILTAYEISQMNLSNTELVVLSACETGLGEIEGNEGVYGLQRAFKIAGAKYLIMSLWEVSDKATRELMIDFYRHWLVDKLDIPEAFRLAQRDVRKNHPTSPYLWAGFVLVE